jgi:hypothetical protein
VVPRGSHAAGGAAAMAPGTLLAGAKDCPTSAHFNREVPMFILLAILLAIAWLGGFTVMHVSSTLIHLLLILAVVSLIAHVARGRRVT